MTSHSSAPAREETSHVTETTNALKRRAQAVLNDTSIDAQSRAIIRYALETHDPWLAELVRRADEGEKIADTFDFSQTPKPNEGDSSERKIEALAEIICRAGDEPAAALFLLMGTLEHSTQSKMLANMAKQFAFTRCGESNRCGIVDAQIAIVESEVLASHRLTS